MSIEISRIHESITNRLAFLIHKLKLDGTFNLQYLNIHSEDFSKELLNLIYGYKLTNLNYSEINSAAIDLCDDSKKIVFQVTTTGAKRKIDSTLSKFKERNYYKKYNKLIILVFKEKYKPDKCDDFELDEFIFSYNEDVWDVNKIVSDIKILHIEKQKEIEKLICEHIPYPDGNSKMIPNYEALINTFIQDYSSLAHNGFFAGRDDKLKYLDNWLNSDKSYCLITSNAGVGKSALITNWYMSLDNEYSIIFIPISNRYQLNSQKVFYEILAYSLSKIFDTFIDLPPNPDFMFYKSECVRMLNNQQICTNKKILVIIDALDEAEWAVEKSIDILKKHARIICSARNVIKHKSENWTQLLKLKEDRLKCIQLENLNSEGVKAVLEKSRIFNDAVLEYACNKLYDATDGDALLLSLILEQIKEDDDYNIEYLDKIPKGYNEYFKDILCDDEIGDSEDFLCILSLSKEPMKLQDIQSVYRKANSENKRISEKVAFGKIRRLISKINDGYTLTHPKLGYYLIEEYFKETTYVDDYQSAFLKWGEEYLDKKNVPMYLLKNLSNHILDSKNLALGQKLLGESWRIAHINSPHRYSYYLNDMFNFRKLLKIMYSLKNTNNQEYIELFIKTSLIIGSINGRGQAMGLESALIAYECNKISYDYMKFLIDKQSSISDKLRFSVLSKESPHTYYSEIEGDKNQFSHWLILLEHPFEEVKEYANQKAVNLVNNITINNVIFEEVKQRYENITLEQVEWITKIERIWGYCKVNPDIKMAKMALDNINYILDPIQKASMKLFFNEISNNSSNAYIKEVLIDLQENLTKINNISQLIEVLMPIKGNVNVEVFEKLLYQTLNDINSASAFRKSILIKNAISILVGLSKGEDNYWEMINRIIKLYPHDCIVSEALVDSISYVHKENKTKLINMAFSQISKLRTGNNQVGSYSKLAKIGNDTKEKAIMLAIDASEKLDDYRSCFGCKINILLKYGSEKELYELMNEISLFYGNYDFLSKFNHLNALSKSQYKDFNNTCIDNFIKELKLYRDSTIFDSRYEQALIRSKEIKYRYDEISEMALNHYLNKMERSQLRLVNPNLLLPKHRYILEDHICEYFASVLIFDYSLQLSVLSFIERMSNSPKRKKLINLLEKNFDTEKDSNNIFYYIQLYKLTGNMKYYRKTIELLHLIQKSQRLYYYIALIGIENIYNDPDDILKTIFQSNCEIDDDINHRIIQYKYEGKSNNEIRMLVFDWLYTKDKEFIKESIRSFGNNELFDNSYKEIWSLAKKFNIADEMEVSLMRKNGLKNIEIWTSIIESASENSRSSIFCRLPEVMQLVDFDYKLVLSFIDDIITSWS